MLGTRIISWLVAVLLLGTAVGVHAQDTPVVIRTGLALDGKGASLSNTTIVVERGRIVRLEGGAGPITYDLRGLTVMPGLIDTHVHITAHFNRANRASEEGESPAEIALAAYENLYGSLMAGFTTLQSIGAPEDLELRLRMARGVLAGPRLLTSISPVTETTGSPDAIRAFVRKVAAGGADLVKLFASKSIREGGGQTMTNEQVAAACGEARALGLRSWVHAHSPDSIRAAVVGGCWAVTHGSMATDAELTLMAERGVYFEPNIGLVSQNYLQHKTQYFGIGNFNDEGFAFMEKGIPMKLAMFKRALRVPNLKLLMGTDAGAGAHGRNVEEVVYRVQQGGQAPMDAVVGVTSLNAAALGLDGKIGVLAPGAEADLIAVDGNPLEDITALRRVVFVMRDGRVVKNTARMPSSQTRSAP